MTETTSSMIARMRKVATDWRRPALRQIEGPNDLRIYGGTIADDIDEWADRLEVLNAKLEPRETETVAEDKEISDEIMALIAASRAVIMRRSTAGEFDLVVTLSMVFFDDLGQIDDYEVASFEGASESEVQWQMTSWLSKHPLYVLIDQAPNGKLTFAA